MAIRKDRKKKNGQPGAHEEAARAFERVRPKLEALEPGELQPVRLDIPKAVEIVLGTEHRIVQLLPRIEELPELSLDAVRMLRDVALAAWWVHVAVAPPDVDVEDGFVRELVAKATPLEKGLLVQAEALAERGLLDRERVAAIRAERGNRGVANGLLALSHLFRNGAVVGKTPVTVEEIDRAAEIGTLLMQALGVRGEDPSAEKARRVDLRMRAFTLLVRSYDAVRRAVTYLRWEEEDAEEIAPSMFKGRGVRRAEVVSPAVPSGPDMPAAPPAP